MNRNLYWRLLTSATCWLALAGTSFAQDDEPANQAPAQAAADPPGLTRLAKDYDVWMDLKRKLVVVDGEVALREGQLEMFACPKGTKEHESIIAVNSQAKFVHAGLEAVGAKVGTPVKFDPEYQPATGTVIDIWILWVDKDGKKQRAKAQDWIRRIKTGKPMQYDFVFAGSGFWTDEETGVKYYHGDGGDFICVSNFPTATLDIPVESSQANASLVYEAWKEAIPPKGTKVRLVLIPRLDKKAATEPKEPTDPATPEDPTPADEDPFGAAEPEEPKPAEPKPAEPKPETDPFGGDLEPSDPEAADPFGAGSSDEDPFGGGSDTDDDPFGGTDDSDPFGK